VREKRRSLEKRHDKSETKIRNKNGDKGRNSKGETGMKEKKGDRNDCQDSGEFFLFRRESGVPIRIDTDTQLEEKIDV